MKQTRKVLRSKARKANRKTKSRKYVKKGGAIMSGGVTAPTGTSVDQTIYLPSLVNSLGTFATTVYTLGYALDSGSQAAATHVATVTSDAQAAQNLVAAIQSLYYAFFGNAAAGGTAAIGLYQTMLPNAAIPTYATFPAPPPGAYGLL